MCLRFCGNDAVHDGGPARTGTSRRQFLAGGAARTPGAGAGRAEPRAGSKEPTNAPAPPHGQAKT